MRRILAVTASVGAVLAVLVLSTSACFATNINLGINLGTSANGPTWSVTAVAETPDSLGLYSFSLDVLGTNGVSALRNNPVSQTNKSPGAPAFGQNRTSGTVQGTNVVNIQASQALTDAFNNDDPSVLTFNLAQPGAPVLLAQGLYSGLSGTLTAQLSPGGFFQLFPQNYDTEHPAGGTPGKVTNVVNASAVISAQAQVVPEPATVLLMGLGGLGLVAFSRRRS